MTEWWSSTQVYKCLNASHSTIVQVNIATEKATLEKLEAGNFCEEPRHVKESCSELDFPAGRRHGEGLFLPRLFVPRAFTTSVFSMRAILPQALSVVTTSRQLSVSARKAFRHSSDANATSAALRSPLSTATDQEWKSIALLFSDSLRPFTNEPHKLLGRHARYCVAHQRHATLTMAQSGTLR